VALAVVSLLAAAAVGSIFLSTASGAWAAIVSAGPASPADGILVVVALGGALLSLWVGLGAALSALSSLPGALGQACTLLAARIAPAAVRKVVAFILGTALTAALVPGTAAARTRHEAPRAGVVASAQYAVGALGSVADVAPNPSFSLVRDTDPAPTPSWSPEGPPSERSDRVLDVVVRRGDSLWSIAARHLGPSASTAQIDAEWHRWFAANRSVIGSDPDAITPGQVLFCPGSVRSDRSAPHASSAGVHS
jgi:nucleoid-associated protein YgaU